MFHQEIDFASIAHFQTCKLQAKAYRLNDEIIKQDISNHANCSVKYTLRLLGLEKHTECSLKHTPMSIKHPCLM